jgi:signal transduction histidine kinase
VDDFKTNFSEFDIRTLLEKLREIFQPMAEHKNLIFTMQVEESVPKKIYQDEQRIGQVLVNIINNAVKYTFYGTILI